MKSLLQDFSFGIIPLRKFNEKWQTFIVLQVGGHWSFPKGHAEKHDKSVKQTAERELFEETGLQVASYLPIEPLSVTYVSQTRPVDKTVKLYFATVSGNVTLRPGETTEGIWINVDDLHQKIVFDQLQNLLKEIKEIVKHLP